MTQPETPKHFKEGLPLVALDAFDPSFKARLLKFTAYADSFLTGEPHDDRHFILKKEHTLRVTGNAWRISEGQGDRALRKIALRAALFHDLGRFEQFSRFGTFADALSLNHGILGAQVLKKGGFVVDEPWQWRRPITTAVLLHNRRDIPRGLGPESLYALRIVRDADKLDILRIMAQYLGPNCVPDDTILLHLKDNPHGVSPAFASFPDNNEPLSYTDMRYINDFRVMLASWLGQMYFAESRVMALGEGHIHIIANGLGGVPEVREKVCMFLAEHDTALRTE